MREAEADKEGGGGVPPYMHTVGTEIAAENEIMKHKKRGGGRGRSFAIQSMVMHFAASLVIMKAIQCCMTVPLSITSHCHEPGCPKASVLGLR